MNCREITRAMDSQIISASGSAKPSSELEEHFTECPSCSERWDELHLLDKLIAQNAILHDPNPFLWTRLQAKLKEQERRQAAGRFAFWTKPFPVLAILWSFRRQAVAAFCTLILLASGITIHQQISNFQNTQLLSQIEAQWNQLSINPDTDNPFRLGLEEKLTGTENPFPVLLEQKRDTNPFGAVKS